MSRQAHHRSDYRVGPHHAWVRRKTYHLTKFGKPGFVGIRLLDSWQNVGPGLYRIPPHLVLEFVDAIRHFRPYADDQTGDVWK